MFRKPGDEPKNKTPLNVLIGENGMGDLICSLIAANFMITKCPWINPLIWVPDYLLDFAKHVLPKNAIVRNFTDAATKYDNTKYGVTTKWSGQITPMKINPVRYSYAVLCDYEPTIEEMSYLKIRPDEINISQFNLPEKFVVLPSAATERVKTIPKETMDALSDYIVSKGYTPIYLGKTENYCGVDEMYGRSVPQDYDFSKGINLLDQTTVLESAAILSKAKLYIGIDGGLTHLCGFTDTPMVVYYSFVKAAKMVPIRDGIVAHNVYPIETSLGCGGCQSKWVQLEHDFRHCFYSDYLCVSSEQCSFDKFKNVIEKFQLL